MVEKMKALADESRLEILRLLGAGEMPAGEIASHFSATRPAISQHLRVLRDAGLLRERRDGTRRMYSIDPAGFSDVRSFLSTFWDLHLVALKHAAEQHHRNQRRRNGRRRTDR